MTIASCLVPSAQAVFVSADSVTATSHFRNGPGTVELNEIELINGHGLNDINLGATALHWGQIQPGPDRNLWHAGVVTAGDSTGVGAAAANVAAQHLDFGFDTVVDLTGIHIWQYNQYSVGGTLLPRGVNTFDLYVSSTAAGEDFVQIGGTNNLALGTLGASAIDYSQAAQTFSLVASNVRRVRLDILTAHSGATNEYVGLDEVHFEAIAPNLTFTVDRLTGAISLANDGAEGRIVGYSLFSDQGALLPSAWTSIAENYDADNNMTVDPDDTWLKISGPELRDELTESELGGSGPHDGAVVGLTPINLGNAWIRNPVEDLTAQVLLAGGGMQVVNVVYTGNGGAPLSVGDLTFDGNITPEDWTEYIAGLGKKFLNLSPAEAYQMGDFDGDLDNDLTDFGLFEAAYDGANGQGALAALISGNQVPEPSAMALFCIVVVTLGACRLRSRRFAVIFSALALGGTISGSCQAEFFSANSVTATSFFMGGATLDPNDLINGSGLDVLTASGLHNGQFADLWHAGVANPGDITGSGNQLADVAGQYLDFSFDDPIELTAIHIWQYSQQHPTADYASRGVNQFALWVSSTSAGEDFVQVGGIQSLNATSSVNQDPNAFLEPAQTFGLVASNVRRVRLDIESAHSGFPTEYVGLDEVHFDAVLPTITLDVNRTSGAVAMRNGTAAEFLINGYEIVSEMGSLNPAEPPTGWNSLSDQDLDAVGGGVGQSWDEGGGSSESILTEAFLLGHSALSADEVIPLGLAYNAAIDAVDLAFHFRTVDGKIHPGSINYFTGETVLGDYNSDGVVNAADYAVWRDMLGQTGAGLAADGNGTNSIDPGDYSVWRQNFGGGTGDGALAATSQTVPEPSMFSLFAILLVGNAFFLRNMLRVAKYFHHSTSLRGIANE